IDQSTVLQSVRKIGLRGANGKLCHVIRPLVLATHAERGYNLETVPDERPAILSDRPLNIPLVIVNKKPRRYKSLEAFFNQRELTHRADGIGRAGAKVSLIMDRRTFRPYVHLIRKQDRSYCKFPIPPVRKVRTPA